jgi:hypothetical protein
MIARTWRGTVRRADADEHVEYIRETGFAEYGQTPGNRGAWMLRRNDGDRTEFVTLSLWDSVDANAALASRRYSATALSPPWLWCVPSKLPPRRAVPTQSSQLGQERDRVRRGAGDATQSGGVNGTGCARPAGAARTCCQRRSSSYGSRLPDLASPRAIM